MKTRTACSLSGAILIVGCSEGTGPSPGVFRAQLSGARVAAMSGASNAGVIYTVDFPDARFAIRMFAQRGDTVRVITILCPGEEPPAPGTYAVTASVSDCPGTYSRVVFPVEGGTIILEQASASSGSVTISASSGDQTVGTFTFTGILVVGTDSVGTVAASGEFSAAVGP
jgi:hypothetical protein